jgi:hypothetical protein
MRDKTRIQEGCFSSLRREAIFRLHIDRQFTVPLLGGISILPLQPMFLGAELGTLTSKWNVQFPS